MPKQKFNTKTLLLASNHFYIQNINEPIIYIIFSKTYFPIKISLKEKKIPKKKKIVLRIADIIINYNLRETIQKKK